MSAPRARPRAVLAVLVGVALVAMAAAIGGGSTATAAHASTARGAQTHRSDCHRNTPPILHDGFPEPPVRYSRNGLLDTQLRASYGPVEFNHRRVLAMNYDGSVPGPTLVICAGDRLVIHFTNALNQPTNLHTHGFHVSPNGHSDNIFLRLNPGQRFTYEYNIPQDMSAGAYWYHPHVHMYVEGQIFGGLMGAIVQEGGLDTLPALRHIPQRWIVIANSEVRNGKIVPAAQESDPDSPLYVNGVLNPTAKIRPGQLQRWRIFNNSADRIIVLRLPDQQRFEILAEDAHTLERPLMARTLLIGPGSRREVLVRGGPPGTYAVKAAPFAQFPGGNTAANGGPVPDQTVITLRSAGRPEHVHFSPRTVLSHPLDLRTKHIDRRRTIIFSEMTTGNNTTFLLNGMTFDPNRTDVTMKLGSVEQWTLVNTNTEWHTFHIHINAFQVVSVNGKRVPYVDYQDNVALAPGSRTVILMHPTDFTGKFVFHCHVTFHEDNGMMATVQVVRGPTPAQLQASVVHDGGFAISSASFGSRARPPAVAALLYLCRVLGIA